MDFMLTTIRTYQFAHEAQLDKSFLEENGVSAIVMGDSPSRPDAARPTLRVPADQVDRALRILEDHER